GPAESTGKSSVTYWPGGTRDGSASSRRRPRKPREIGDTPVRLNRDPSLARDDVSALEPHVVAGERPRAGSVALERRSRGDRHEPQGLAEVLVQLGEAVDDTTANGLDVLRRLGSLVQLERDRKPLLRR